MLYFKIINLYNTEDIASKGGLFIIYKLFYDKRGFTIVELLITLVILNIVLGLGYTYYQYSLNSFNKGSSQSIVQQDIRIGASSISNYVRFATELEILNTTTSIPQNINNNDDNNYIFVDSDGIIKHRDKNGTVSIPNGLSDGLDFTLNFKSVSSGKSLYFKVTDTDNTYDIETNVVILNLTTNNIIGFPDGVAVRYKTTASTTTSSGITSVVLSPTSHMVGNSQNISVNVLTCNISNGINVLAEFVDIDGYSLDPVLTVSGTVSNNTCNLTLPINNSIPAGNYMVKVTVDGVLYPYYVPYNITPPPLTIDTTDPPAAIVEKPYTHIFTASGGFTPYVFTVTGNLPNGLSLNSSTGELTGTPSQVNTYTFTITVTDGDNETSSHEFTITTTIEQFNLTVSQVGNGTTSPALGSHVYDKDFQLTLTAIPDLGYDFQKWVIDGVDYASATSTITMDKDKNAVAYFVVNPVYDFYNFIQNDNVFVYGNQFVFSGNQVNGPNATIVVKGNLDTNQLNGGSFSNVSNIYIDGYINLDGGSAGLGSSTNPGAIYVDGNLTLWSGTRNIYGDVYVNGNFSLKDAKIHGNVYVNGNVNLGWTPTLDNNVRIYYTGALTYPGSYPINIISKCIKVTSVPSFYMPNFDIPPVKADSWFSSHGYVSGGNLADGIKIFANNYSFSDWRSFNDVIIVSKGDITLSNWMTVTGVLFAPNGKVTFGGASFTGLVIAKDGFFVTSGGSTVTFKNISYYIPNVSDYPF